MRQVTFTEGELIPFDNDGEGAGWGIGDASKEDYLKPWKKRLLQYRCQSLDVVASSSLLPVPVQEDRRQLHPRKCPLLTTIMAFDAVPES